MRKGIAAVAAIAGFAASPASAYTALYAFGDSLSDVGNVYAASGGKIPIAPYYDGRFSNGPNWVDDLSADLGLGPVTPSARGGDDFAVGGAQTGPTIVNPGVPLVDLDQQVDSFTTLHSTVLSPPKTGALYTLDIGANDIGNALAADATNSAALSTFLTQAVDNTVSAVDKLYTDGARDLLFYQVPDLSVVPAFEKYGRLAGTLASAFNQGVLKGLQPLEAQGLAVFDVPVFNAIRNVVANPARYGFANAADPCFSGNYDTPGTECADPGQYVFWDTEHPTAAAHALTAEVADDVLEGKPDPVGAPEPSTWAMMLTGLAGLGLARAVRRGLRAQSEKATLIGT
ncbi:putative secreted protein with PEP-CTERM sorting signal [Roseiarcus fermentans]|uniref:Putative secreted protein with PEP-CTERM sorting signal n=1 Tax=Roseiarcus fermentans TaxID=1473586 RepID=A0A366EVP3_9HYPH|nr:SGNH/GDSL hydrolase family protein [Roseiarcus fermentans]RBP06457.1 putative secreted protein with PEP-CTERM sorting signal [Roseiarcus fermentans]